MTAGDQPISAASDASHDAAAPAVIGTGAQLRAAREAAGLSVDQVAQQLKLAPRQVKALEDDNFNELPGRTFTRGFVRNYARLLALDADALIAVLPDAAHAPSLEPPSLHSTQARMGELPSSQRRGSNLGSWLIALVLVGCVLAAATYEWYRSGPGRLTEIPTTTIDAPPASNATPAAPSVPLPNPVTNRPSSENDTPADAARIAALAPTEQTPAGAGTAAATALPSSAVPAPATAQTATAVLPASPAQSVAPVITPSGDAAPASSADAAADAALVIDYRERSWTQIRDRRGRVLISQTVDGNSRQAIDGAPPLSVVLGKADAVTVTYRGAPVDLAPHTRANVARLVLR